MIEARATDRSAQVFGLLIVTVALAVWWVTANRNPNVRLLISRPDLIASHFAQHGRERFVAFGYTAFESAAGLAIAALFSILSSIAFIYSRRLTKLVYPWLVASQIIPLIALAPLIILLFGNGPSGKIALSALMTFFPILTNILAGFSSIPRTSLEDMTLRGASRRQTIRYVVYPFTLPHLFAGLRIAAPLSVIGAVVAEFNGADYGVGRDIFIAARRLEPEIMMASLLLSATLAGLQYGAVRALERLPGAWYRKER